MANESEPITERVERYARAMCEANGIDPDRSANDGSHPCVFVSNPSEWQLCIPAAKAAIALADAEAAERPKIPEGYWLAPDKATPEMLDLMPRMHCGYHCNMEGPDDDPQEAWRDIKAAAPRPNPTGADVAGRDEEGGKGDG